MSTDPNPGGHGVRSVRFANSQDGWVFGPDLWATHDGGAHWSAVTLPGVSASAAVVALEAVAGSATAAVFDAAVEIETSAVGSDSWQKSTTAVPFGAGPVPRAQLVVSGSAGWLVEVDRGVVGGARVVHGAWTAWTPPCAGRAGDAELAAATGTDLVALCDEGIFGGNAPPTVAAYVSSNGGNSFAHAGGSVPISPAAATRVALLMPGRVVVAAGGVLIASNDGARSWTVVYRGSGTSRPEDLGFTSVDQGVVVETDGAAATLLMTFDAGRHWAPVAFG